MKEFYSSNNIAVKQTQRIVVAKDKNELEGIYELQRRTEINGVETQIIIKEEVALIDPNIKTHKKALFHQAHQVLIPKRYVNFNLKEMVAVLYYESKLFILNAFNFRNLAIEEMRNYSKKIFIQKANNMVKSIGDDFKAILAGIRTQLLNTKTNELVQDFVVEHGVNSTHRLNAVSPAFTCSFAFSKYVIEEINKKRGWI